MQSDGKTFGEKTIEHVFDKKNIYHDNEIEGYIQLHHKPRLNSVTGRTELYDNEKQSYVPITDRLANSLVRALKRKGAKITRVKLDELLSSDFSPNFHPFRSYFSTLPQTEGDAHIRAFADRVRVKEPQAFSGVTIKGKQLTNTEWFRECFKRWLIATVAGAIYDKCVNHTVIILAGAQGIGKTMYTRMLLPESLAKYYYNGVINLDDKDTQIVLAECFLILWDEMCATTRTETTKIKEIITKDQIRVRRPYGKYAEVLNRHASIIGSVNDTQLLTDTTGNRRFLIHEVESIDYKTPVDIDKIWAEAYSYCKQGYKHWFDYDEIEQINAYNAKFEQHDELEERLLARYLPGDGRPNEEKMTATDIMDKLYENTNRQYGRNDVIKLGKILKKHGYLSSRNKNQKRYHVLSVTDSIKKQMFDN